MSARRAFWVGLLIASTVLSLGSGLGSAHPVGAPAGPVLASPDVPFSAPSLAPAGTAGRTDSLPGGSAGNGTGAASGSQAPSLSARAAQEKAILAQAKSDGLPLTAVSLPNFLGTAAVTNGVVGPIDPVAPAPMGIGAFGVLNTTGTPTPYTIETSSWEGSISIGSVNTFWLDNDGAVSTAGTNNTFGVQLNAITNDTTVGDTSTGAFWAQNVFYWNIVPGSITFLDNIWNFSSPSETLTAGTIAAGNGTPVYPTFYYDFGPTISVSLPVTVHLYLNSSTTDDPSNGVGYSTVRFGYDVVDAATGAVEASGVYDTVMFNSSLPDASVPASPFLVDGSQLTPTGFLPYDAELMIGGPGGGTTTSVYGIDATESLQYWQPASAGAGHGFGPAGRSRSTGRYVNPESAWNEGGDTGETSEGIAETYTTPGTVSVTAGPSIPAPLWNATPGGNAGQATFSGTLSPTNAFVFFDPGKSTASTSSAWAPTQTASHVRFVLPPGTYTVTAMLSDYRPVVTTVTGRSGGTTSIPLSLARDALEGVYTPLVAWDNAQLAAISSGGRGTSASPYVLVNNAPPGGAGLDPDFGEANDYLYPVFPGLLLAGTTASVDVVDPSLFGVTYAAVYGLGLEALGLPPTNHLQFELFDASDVSIWGARGITGWFYYGDPGPTGFLPLANLVIWDGAHDLVGDSTFVSQGSSLLLAGADPTVPTGNVVWGNTFENSTDLSATMYPGDGISNGPPIAIFAFEGGDLLYDNLVDTSITSYAPDTNLFTGSAQTNLENWNLSMVEPSSWSTSFNGHTLTGTIVRSTWQGGNSWGDYTAGSGLPYDEYGFIASGGDYFPLPLTAYTVTFLVHGLARGAAWSVTLDGVTESTSASSLTFDEVPGDYSYAASVVRGSGYLNPSGGSVTVGSSNVSVTLSYV